MLLSAMLPLSTVYLKHMMPKKYLQNLIFILSQHMKQYSLVAVFNIAPQLLRGLNIVVQETENVTAEKYK